MILISEYSRMRQAEEEWDNPFQPEGEVSQDADLIIQLWKGGRLAETEDLHENLKTLALESSETDSKDDSLESSEGNIVAPVNGHSKVSTPTKIPVISSSDMNYIVMMKETDKHRNKIKKHCNLM